MAWCGTKKAAKLLKSSTKVVVFDLETTGPNPQFAEILQISICDSNGYTLYSSYVKPKAKSWKSAEKVNHISPSTVANAPTFDEIKEDIQKVFNGAKVVAGYNCQHFDIPILERYGIVLPTQCFDVYQEFKNYHPSGGTHKLIDCAEFCGVSFSPHAAESDARATAECMQYLLRCPGFVKIDKELEKSNIEPAEVSESEKKSDKQRRRLFPRSGKCHPVIVGLIIAAIGFGVIYCNMGGSIQTVFGGFPNLSQFLSAIIEDAKSMVFGALIPIGVLIAVVGIIKKLKKAFLWIVNSIKKLFG